MSLLRASSLRLAALLLIILIGFYLRSIPRSDTLVDPDSYFHYKMVKQILSYGSIPEIDYSSYYPSGRRIAGSEPLLLSYAAAYSYLLASFTGLSLMDYLVLFPALAWIANCFVFYFLSKKFCSDNAALTSTALYAFVPAGVARTFMGDFDKENLALPLVLLYLLLLLKASEEKRRGAALALSAGSGAALALAGLTWGGFYYFLLLISAAVFVQMIARKTNETQLFVYGISTTIAIAAVTILLPLKYSLLSFKFPIFIISLSLLCMLSPIKQKINYFALIGVILIIVVFQAEAGRLLLQFKSNEERFVAEEVETKILGDGPNLALQFLAGEWWIYFQALILVAPFGLLRCARNWISRRKFEDALLIIWALSSVLAAAKMGRLVVLAAPVLSILAARALESAYIVAEEKKKKFYYPIIGLLAGLTLFTALYGGFIFADAQYKGIPYPYWKEALDWAKENTPNDSLILAYWDKGYWIQGIAERYSFADNSNAMRSRNKELIQVFCSGDEDEILGLLARHNITNPTYLAVGMDDVPKTLAMRIEGNCSIVVSSWLLPKKNINATGEVINYLEKHVALPEKKDVYYVSEQGDYYLAHVLDYSAPEEKQRLLLRLLPFSEVGSGKKLRNFRLVYNNSGAYIYEVVRK